jgi:hypothetical protein
LNSPQNQRYNYNKNYNIISINKGNNLSQATSNTPSILNPCEIPNKYG